MIQRTTELRHLEGSKVHEISLILDENDGWKKVMSSIPKKLSSSYSYDGSVDWEKLTDEVGYKYTNDEIRKIASPRQGDSRLPAEIFIDEWATSGKKESRATVGMFLQLLVKAELFRAADLVAQKWLGEEPPERPTKGPAARINISLPSEFFNEVASYAGDSAFQPDTEDLHINEVQMNGKMENNQDFYTKFRCEKKNWSTVDSNVPPMPAPRRNRKSERLQSQEQTANHQSTREVVAANAATTATMNGSMNGEHEKTTTVEGATESTEVNATQQLPLLPVFFPQLNSNNDVSTSDTGTTVSTTIESSAPIPLLSALQESVKSDSIMTDTGDLPAISALNLNGQHDNDHENAVQSENHINENQQNGVLANDLDSNDGDDENEENSLSKMSSSNNDSSLTNVTGTSDENSFELSSSSASNENIPLNVLQY